LGAGAWGEFFGELSANLQIYYDEKDAAIPVGGMPELLRQEA
jgi:hypothetical protein